MRHPTRTALISLSTALLASTTFVLPANGQFTFRTVVTSTDLLPSLGAPNGFDSFEYAIISSDRIPPFNQRLVAFVGTAEANKGIWGETYVNGPPELAKIVQMGDGLPSGLCSSSAFLDILYPSMNIQGDVAFIARDSGIGGCAPCGTVGAFPWEGYFRWSAEDNVLDVMAEISTPVTIRIDVNTLFPAIFYGNTQLAFDHGFAPMISQSGYITSYTRLSNCPAQFNLPVSAQFVGNTPGFPIERADTKDSSTLDQAGSMSNPSMNNSAAIAYFAELNADFDALTGTADPNDVDYQILFSDSDTPTPIVSEGATAPGGGTDFVFTELNFHPDINNLGTIAFYAKTGIVENGMITSQSGGIWRGNATAGLFAPVFQHGDEAPGTASGINFSGFGDPILNGADRVAFVGYLDQANPNVDASNDFGIWFEFDGLQDIHDLNPLDTFFLVAREGSPAPGIANATFVPKRGASSPFYDPFMNALGQVAFKAHWSAPGLKTSDGIWATDSNGTTQLIIARNQTIDVNGQQKTVASLTFGRNEVSAMGVSAAATSGGEDGRGTSFNDDGEVVFIATFTDGTSGVFVATPTGSGSILAPDADGDGIVTFSDVRMLVSTWGTDDARSDINRDGVVDSADLALVLKALD